MIQTRTTWGHEYRVEDLVAEFSARLREELDYRIEARNAAAIAATMPGDAHIRVPFVYDELRRIAGYLLRGERSNHTLQATALVNEAWIKLARQRKQQWENATHFRAVAARAMRQVLVETARARVAIKRSVLQEVAVAELPDVGQRQDRSVVAMEDALRELEKTDRLKVRLIEMRFFAGMTAEESAPEGSPRAP